MSFACRKSLTDFYTENLWPSFTLWCSNLFYSLYLDNQFPCINFGKVYFNLYELSVYIWYLSHKHEITHMSTCTDIYIHAHIHIHKCTHNEHLYTYTQNTNLLKFSIYLVLFIYLWIFSLQRTLNSIVTCDYLKMYVSGSFTDRWRMQRWSWITKNKWNLHPFSHSG